jgi:23S rRNA (uracil1939-C5)-methyltransferase
MRLAIEKLVYPGRSLAVLDGRVVFADEGLPGETVEAEPAGERGNYLEAKTTRVLTASPARVAPRCAHYRACSLYQTLDYPAQIEVKRGQLAEILAGAAPVPASGFDLIPSPDVWGYRNKVRFGLRRDGGDVRLAYNAPGSRDELVPVDDCRLVARPVMDILQAALDVIRGGDFRTLSEIEARQAEGGREILINLFWSGAPAPGDIDGLVAGLSSRAPLVGIVSQRRRGRGWSETTEWGRGWIEDRAAGTAFLVGARSFFQVNVPLLGRVIADIRAAAAFTGAERLADLYCGVGTFGLALAGAVREVHGVESDPANIDFLRRNIERSRVRSFKMYEGTAEEWAGPLLAAKTDAAVFDPPRKGLGPEIVQALLAAPPARLFYLSCNPTTLARDVKALAPAFGVALVRGYDFFPHTPHIETLAVLEKK